MYGRNYAFIFDILFLGQSTVIAMGGKWQGGGPDYPRGSRHVHMTGTRQDSYNHCLTFMTAFFIGDVFNSQQSVLLSHMYNCETHFDLPVLNIEITKIQYTKT